jgi:hypothetical protein
MVGSAVALGVWFLGAAAAAAAQPYLTVSPPLSNTSVRCNGGAATAVAVSAAVVLVGRPVVWLGTAFLRWDGLVAGRRELVDAATGNLRFALLVVAGEEFSAVVAVVTGGRTSIAGIGCVSIVEASKSKSKQKES